MNTVSIMTFKGSGSPLNFCVVCIHAGAVWSSGTNESPLCGNAFLYGTLQLVASREAEGAEGLSSLCNGFNENGKMNRSVRRIDNQLGVENNLQRKTMTFLLSAVLMESPVRPKTASQGDHIILWD